MYVVSACTRPRVYRLRTTGVPSALGATDNMQLRAVSSTLSCCRSTRPRALSLAKRLRHAWRKRREHADNETVTDTNDPLPTLHRALCNVDRQRRAVMVGPGRGRTPSPRSTSSARRATYPVAIDRSADHVIIDNLREHLCISLRLLSIRDTRRRTETHVRHARYTCRVYISIFSLPDELSACLL